MTASEFVFLAMGLVLGVAAGAALVEFIRARPPAPREVRVTVAADAVPRRRAATLANDAFTESPVALGPARGGPADPRVVGSTGGTGTPDRRTPVLTPRPSTSSPAPIAPPRAAVAGAMPISTGIDPMLTALRASAAASATAAMQTGSVAQAATAVLPAPEIRVEASSTAPASSSASSEATEATSRVDATGDGGPDAATGPDIAAPPAEAPSGPCGEARRLAEERCELASRARAQAVKAEATHRAAQRAYDDHESAAAAAATAADARAVRGAKDEAQARFRAGRAGARTVEEVEAAARDWLLEINRINSEAGDAATALARARAAAPEMAVRIDQTAVAADGARIIAESAEAACLAARQAVADCEERAAGGVPSPAPTSPGDGDEDTTGDTLAAALRAGAAPRIVRLLRGDRTALQDVVAALGGQDAEERRRWQVALSDLVDAILADAIDASVLEFPSDHSFWGPFNRSQSRDITAALASLGYRFDGLGGWVDDRSPSQRDLSLALGYAGLDPMRLRQWPNEAQMATLFGEVTVAAAEHLADAAGDLTLGELVTMLGGRADRLAEIWNAWGRIRPLLLDET